MGQDIIVLYQFFTEVEGLKVPLNEFHNGLNMVNMNSVLDYIDSKLSINTLYSKEGQFIKVVE